MYHFIGIGGIGMSSLAKLLLMKMEKVKGSDLASNENIEELKKLGAKIFFSHKKENVSDDDIIIYSSAIKEDNEELIEAKKKNLTIWHRSNLLAHLIKDHYSIAIAGSHGKTTTTSLTTQVLLEDNPSYAIGGILKSTNTNANLGNGKYFVLEADESDGSFLNYQTEAAIVTNIEQDHMDYWKRMDNLKDGFRKFLKKDLLIWCKDDPILNDLKPKGLSYGFDKSADLYAENIREKDFQLTFDIIDNRSKKSKRYENVQLNLIGHHNVLNGLAVFLLFKELGYPIDKIFRAFGSFQGVKRRMDKLGEKNGIIFFDDYAHHPSEIFATLSALKKHVKARLLVIFQPHRYTRTKDLFDQFAISFNDVNLILTDIYSANEKPIDNIDSKSLFLKIKNCKAKYVAKEDLKNELISIMRPTDTVIFMGAGDISKIGRKIFQEYEQV